MSLARGLARPLATGLVRGGGDAGGVESGDFITTWETTAPSESITIPLQDSATNLTVDWGDGSTSEITTYNDADLTHTYDDAGTYTVKLLSGGTFGGFRFNNAGDKLKISSVEQWGNLVWVSCNVAFDGCANCEINASDLPLTGNVTNFNAAWRNNNLTTFPLIDTSSGTSFINAWRGNSLTSFPLIDTSSGTSFNFAWEGNDMGTASWSALLIDLDANNPNTGVPLHGGDATYSAGAAATARAALIARTPGWTITDGGPA